MTSIALTRSALLAALVGGIASAPALAEMRPTLAFSGVTGLIDMPSGDQQSDGVFSITAAHFGTISRTTLSFQITPRLSGSFRYSAFGGWNLTKPSQPSGYFDRSFDLRYQVLEESRYLPALTIGLQDVIGTGFMAGEYIAATKTIADRFKVTAGLGWGRYGGYGAIGDPFGPRPPVDFGLGGRPRIGQWFKGDMAPFAGVEWQINDRWGLKAEYSSDAYAAEVGKGIVDRQSPFNFGLEYQYSNSIRLGAYSLYGAEFGLAAQIVLDPKRHPTGGPLGPGPLPVVDRPAKGVAGWSQDWATDAASLPGLRDRLQTVLGADGLVIETLAVTATSAELRLRNPRIDAAPQAIGRAARAMAAVLPPSVDVFEIVPVVDGLALSKIVLRRTDLEQLDHAAGQDALIRERTEIQSATARAPIGALAGQDLYPKFSWNVSPYLRVSLFDPNYPVLADLGLRASARYDLRPGLVLSGAITKKLVGNLDKSDRVSDSKAPHLVRSEANKYDAQGDPAIETLTLAWFTKPAPDLYSRVTLGYLERMYGGISAEVLWKPVNRPYALGLEVNYAQQRDFDQLFGFQDYGTVTGHISGYYDFGNGFLAQLDLGRYLAGDYGMTLTLDREFANGWKVGAFATLTDMPFETFGEGSFDKGIRIQIPFAWLTGGATRKTYATTLRPLLRDGGARLEVEGRLYNTVRDYHASRLDDQWGRFWQ